MVNQEYDRSGFVSDVGRTIVVASRGRMEVAYVRQHLPDHLVPQHLTGQGTGEGKGQGWE